MTQAWLTHPPDPGWAVTLGFYNWMLRDRALCLLDHRLRGCDPQNCWHPSYIYLEEINLKEEKIE